MRSTFFLRHLPGLLLFLSSPPLLLISVITFSVAPSTAASQSNLIWLLFHLTREVLQRCSAISQLGSPPPTSVPLQPGSIIYFTRWQWYDSGTQSDMGSEWVNHYLFLSVCFACGLTRPALAFGLSKTMPFGSFKLHQTLSS